MFSYTQLWKLFTQKSLVYEKAPYISLDYQHQELIQSPQFGVDFCYTRTDFIH